MKPVNSIHQLILTAAVIAGTLSLSAKPAASVLDLSQYAADSTLVLPESFETDTHKMMENWYLVNYTALDADVDLKPDEEVSDEEITRRLAAIPTTIELPFNSIVRAYIDAYTKKNRRLVENMLGMSLYYMPIFEEALEREGLPMELKYLPVIESAMNPDAVSRSGATGLWQLMLPTARGFELEVSTLVDERRDPVASSAAAAKLLHQLYDIYHDWSLAIAAYNCGPGNVNKALRRSTADKKDFWSIYPYLPKETRGYLPGFIAATYVMTYYKHHNISPALAKRPILTDSVHVGRRVYFKQISDVLQIPVEELKVLNPQYRQECIPGDIHPYPLVLPANLTYSYIMSEDAICDNNAELYERRLTVEPFSGELADTPAQADNADGQWVETEKVLYHKVRKGETLSSIAKKYGVSVWSLKHANGNIKSARRGQTLKIVTTERVFKPNAPEATPPAEGDDLLVKQDTPKEVATPAIETPAQDAPVATAPVTPVKEETPAPVAEAPKKAAPAKNTAKAAPKKAAPAKSKKKQQPATKTVTARNGDSLDKIAKKNGTTVKELKRLNGLSGNNPVIQPGQKIRVK
ncbi:MAG: transglycosylase SLT domain-containing protein [Muribaculaceae bacterium]|nr:transglycosylase SLT domain-containing protein [Muribaculaceae bacterium]